MQVRHLYHFPVLYCFHTIAAAVLQSLSAELGGRESDGVDSSSASNSEDGGSDFDANDVDELDDVDDNGEKFYASRPRRPPRDAVEVVNAVSWKGDADKSAGCRNGFAYEEMQSFSKEVVQQIHKKEGGLCVVLCAVLRCQKLRSRRAFCPSVKCSQNPPL